MCGQAIPNLGKEKRKHSQLRVVYGHRQNMRSLCLQTTCYGVRSPMTVVRLRPFVSLLCFFHHRLLHEGGWHVVREGREFRFIPPERVVMRRTRGPGLRWAA